MAAAKARIVEHVRDAELQWGHASWQTLEESVLRAEGLWREGQGVGNDPRSSIVRLAAAEAVLQLLASGVLLPRSERIQRVWATTPLVHSQTGQPLDASAIFGEIPVPAELRLTARAREDSDYATLFHPDVYLGRLGISNAHRRVRQSIGEAVRSLRQDAYLAAATMLGSASEGAWLELFASFNAWSAKKGAPKAPVTGDNLAGKVLTSATAVFGDQEFKRLAAERGISGTVWKGLVAEYDYLREFRNFAVHFDTTDDFDLSYPVVSGLFIRCTDYFSRIYALKDALDRGVAT